MIVKLDYLIIIEVEIVRKNNEKTVCVGIMWINQMCLQKNAFFLKGESSFGTFGNVCDVSLETK